ncbi:MAG TPA: hypothetical protein VH189_12320 [Rhizomicrobium sp.]|nr:hypothetical protein [Rhizomicrobium sp.]
MSRPDFFAAAEPGRATTRFRDSETAPVAAGVGLPHVALALLPVLHREAGRELHLWRLLASSPRFCVALMVEGAVVLAWNAQASLSAEFIWAVAVLLGVAALTDNHIRGFARTPRQVSLPCAARELRLLLLYLGLAWGLGALLVPPPAPALALFFVAVPGLTAAAILKDEVGTIAFGASTGLLAAGAATWHGGPQAAVTMEAILFTAVTIAGISMLQRAMRRRLRG